MIIINIQLQLNQNIMKIIDKYFIITFLNLHHHHQLLQKKC